MWDERYAQPEYIYGIRPNDFLRENAALLGGPVLSLAEGEGRNAVFLAGLGLDVLGVDASAIGLQKALALAEKKGVQIRTEIADLGDYNPPETAFGAVVSIFAHTPSIVRVPLHERVRSALTAGGVFLLEAYTPAQVGRGTGGPKLVDSCVTLRELTVAFDGFDILVGRECERDVIEGTYHTGRASVVQFIARKR